MLIIPQNRTFPAKVRAKRNGEYITLGSGEKFIFCLKKNPDDTTAIIQKELTSSNLAADEISYLMTLSYNETNIASGYYYYDVTYYTSGGAYTVILAEECYVPPAIYRRTS